MPVRSLRVFMDDVDENVFHAFSHDGRFVESIFPDILEPTSRMCPFCYDEFWTRYLEKRDVLFPFVFPLLPSLPLMPD